MSPLGRRYWRSPCPHAQVPARQLSLNPRRMVRRVRADSADARATTGAGRVSCWRQTHDRHLGAHGDDRGDSQLALPTMIEDLTEEETAARGALLRRAPFGKRRTEPAPPLSPLPRRATLPGRGIRISMPPYRQRLALVDVAAPLAGSTKAADALLKSSIVELPLLRQRRDKCGVLPPRRQQAVAKG